MTTTNVVECKRNRKRKRIRKERKAFLATLPDDVVIQIFLRLPSGRSLIRCASVCKHWHSLIYHNPSFDDFVTMFNQYHRSTTHSLHSSYETSTLFHCKREAVFYELPSTKLKNPKPYDLSFLPNYKSLVIVASCRDLLLLVTKSVTLLYVCNFLTRHWFLLPTFPDICFFFHVGFALVCHSQNNPDSYRYKVVIMYENYFKVSEYKSRMYIFDSETALWTHNHFSLPYVTPRRGRTRTFHPICYQVVTTSKGIAHWLAGTNGIYILAAFDPFSLNYSLIPLPSMGFHFIPPHDSQGRVCIGVVHGQLRLLLMEQHDPIRFYFRIWELDSTNDSWTLIHHYLQTFSDAAKCRAYFVHSFDPLNDNVIYLVRGTKIRRFEIDQNKDVGICKFLCRGGSVDEGETWRLAATSLRVFPLLHPLWPTPISSNTSRRLS